MIDPIAAGAPRELTREAAQMREAAVQLEAAFLSEMLKASGAGEPSESFGGGAGEEQFSSLLRDQQALAMARAGGIGLAEAIFASLAGNAGEAGRG